MIRRLANVKTRSQTGFEYVLNSLEPGSPFGKKALKECRPFFPGSEEELIDNLDRTSSVLDIVKNHREVSQGMAEIFGNMKDNSFTVERSEDNILSMVELFEMKTFLIQCEELNSLTEKVKDLIPKDFILIDTTKLLDILDPGGDRAKTFYLYDEFSKSLGSLRRKKHELDKQLRKEQKNKKNEVEKKYGICLTPKFDYVISKGESEELCRVDRIDELEICDQDFMCVTYSLKKTDEECKLLADILDMENKIEEEEEVIREKLSKDIHRHKDILNENFRTIGELDFSLSKAFYAETHDCIRPEIISEHVIRIEKGRQLQAEDILRSKNKKYMPVDIDIEQGITCITGANMGGKTITLKMVGMVQLLAQYGIFVPCGRCELGLSNHIQILIGDSQSLERGLSSFGSEMEELKEILDKCTDRSFILIDEIASGTNPSEGLALTKALMKYLLSKPYISLMTTHYDVIDDRIKNMQVTGLGNADFAKIKRQLEYANRKERIEIIGNHMDYRLSEVGKNAGIPKDALKIAEMLGINENIINWAKEDMCEEYGEKR